MVLSQAEIVTYIQHSFQNPSEARYSHFAVPVLPPFRSNQGLHENRAMVTLLREWRCMGLRRTTITTRTLPFAAGTGVPEIIATGREQQMVVLVNLPALHKAPAEPETFQSRDAKRLLGKILRNPARCALNISDSALGFPRDFIGRLAAWSERLQCAGRNGRVRLVGSDESTSHSSNAKQPSIRSR